MPLRVRELLQAKAKVQRLTQAAIDATVVLLLGRR